MSGLQCLHPTKWQVRQAEWGKYVSSPRFKISPPSLVNSGGADSPVDWLPLYFLTLQPFCSD